jgi:hypothetical protein
MFNFILILGLLSTASGVFVVGFGFPIRETTFGSALLVAGAVAIAGGFVTIGLAAAVAELRRVAAALKARVPAVPRPLRPVERQDGSEKRPGPPRMPFPARPDAEAPAPDSPVPTQPAQQAPPMQRIPATQSVQPIPSAPPARPIPSFPEAVGAQPAYPVAAQPAYPRPGALRPVPAPPVEEHREEVAPPNGPHPSSPEWLRRAFAEIAAAQPGTGTNSGRYQDDLRSADDWPRTSPPPAAKFITPPEAESPDWRQRDAGGESNMFEAVWPSGRQRPADISVPEKHDEERREPFQSRRPAEPTTRLAEFQPHRMAAPPPVQPASAPSPPPALQSILKSGVIDEMAYTLFTDGSIEAQMPDGTMRFASIDELRRHLDTQGG